MNEEEFRAELRRMAQINHIYLTPGQEDKLVAHMRPDIKRGPRFVNIFKGSDKSRWLVPTSFTTWLFEAKLLRINLLWAVPHDQLQSVDVGRSIRMRYMVDSVDLTTSDGMQRGFWVGFNDLRAAAAIAIARDNALLIKEQIETAQASMQESEPAPGALRGFDPDGPEKAGAAAKEAYSEGQWLKSFQLYVKAIDRLHDFYVFEQFRNRQPSPRDAWLINGLTASLGITRDRMPDADVREGVREATHRLRTIAHATEQAGGNATLYRSALDEMARYAKDIDVSDIYWT